MRGSPAARLTLARRWTHFASRLQAVTLFRLLRVDEHSVVLDLGCGRGGISNQLALEGHRVICVDKDAASLFELRALSNALRNTERITPVIADVGHLPFRSGAFATVICNSVLEHLDSPVEALSESARVMRPGAVLGLTTPNRACRFAWRLEEPWAAVLRLPRGLKRLVLTPELALSDNVGAARRHLESRFDHKVLFVEAELRALLSSASIEVTASAHYMTRVGAVCHDIAYGFRGARRGPSPFAMRLVAKADRLTRGPGKGFALVATRRVDQQLP